MKRYWPALVIIAVLAQRLWAFQHYPRCAEDAYITFHASLNPAWMKAATSPLWAMVCGLGDPPQIARTLSLLADLLACGVALATFALPGALVFCAFWCSPFMTGSAISGLETHLAACALVCALRWPQALALACLRPDTIAMAVVVAAGRRWRWPLLGAAVFVLSSLLLTGRPLSQTATSKLAAYGHAWFQGWIWWHSEGLGWLELLLIAGGCVGAYFSRRWLYLTAALLPLIAHWALGTPNFYWYAVPPAAMLAALACERMSWRAAAVAGVLLWLCWWSQTERLEERNAQEYFLWKTGEKFASYHPSGTVLLEPAGIIPYLNPAMNVVDEIGLIDPWMAQRRKQGVGWMADAVDHYRPKWLLVRSRFLRNPFINYTGNGEPFRSEAEMYHYLGLYYIQALPVVPQTDKPIWASCAIAICERK